MFCSGAFGDDIGEDFFGIKELGLDKELNLDRLNVCYNGLYDESVAVDFSSVLLQIPIKLWYGKDKAKAQVAGE